MLIGILHLIVMEKIDKVAHECRVLLTNILGFYYSILRQLKSKDIEKYMKTFEEREI